jgi:hypothetical protein
MQECLNAGMQEFKNAGMQRMEDGEWEKESCICPDSGMCP